MGLRPTDIGLAVIYLSMQASENTSTWHERLDFCWSEIERQS
jgi:hypothetical protein